MLYRRRIHGFEIEVEVTVGPLGVLAATLILAYFGLHFVYDLVTLLVGWSYA